MKKILIIASLFFLTTSCGKKFKLVVSNGIMTENWVYCDSFQMISEKEAIAVVDGDSIHIKSTVGIYPESTSFFGY
jgi:hypothetical protein